MKSEQRTVSFDVKQRELRSPQVRERLEDGITELAAREKVRVARALPGLPQISAAFREGRLSYSKVRAISRIAKPENEPSLLNMALNEENRHHALRELSWQIDDDGR